MEKIKLELDELEVTTFAMQRAPGDEEGTVVAHSTIEGCGYTFTFPVGCRTSRDPALCPTDICRGNGG
jgi:hypothetical protein